MRRTSPCTRIIGGSPEDKCRSEALFLTTKASSSVRSITISPWYAKSFSSLLQRIMATIEENVQGVKARIARAARAAGRDPESVTLLAVSKTHPVERIAQAKAAGLRAFGENYVQEATAKMAALDEMRFAGIEWHLIGPLQANKTRIAAERFDWVQTVDRVKIASRLSEQRPAHLPPLNVLIQVNVSG